MNASHIDPEVYAYLPHRPPMLLIQRLVSVSADCAEAELTIDEHSAFFTAGRGVPVEIGLEYMGQTAALMAGYQREQGLCPPHLGFLLGSRKFTAQCEWFAPGSCLRVRCEQVASVADSLATFACLISDLKTGTALAQGNLSVMRRPLVEQR